MSRLYACDQCGTNVTADPIELAYYGTGVDDDDDEIDEWTEWHMCSWSCLTSFAMAQALDGDAT